MRVIFQRHLCAALLAALLSGCGAELQPFESVPRLPGRDPALAADRVGICYNALFTTPEAVLKTATSSCGPGQVATLEKQDIRFACPFLLPVRATFNCSGD